MRLGAREASDLGDVHMGIKDSVPNVSPSLL